MIITVSKNNKFFILTYQIYSLPFETVTLKRKTYNEGFMSNYTNYWAKTSPYQRLIYHCLDVAAVGHILFQQSLQDDKYEDVLTQKITRDKEISLFLITLFVLMHDLGKFSYVWQNKDRGAVKKVHGNPCKDCFCNAEHDLLGFLLCQKEIWPKIWHENWLGLDHHVDEYYLQDIMKSWFRSVTEHHGFNRNFDNKYNPDFLRTYFIDENIKDACDFVEDAAKIMLNNKLKKPSLEIYKDLDDTFNHTSKILHYLTKRSDQLVSGNSKHFRNYRADGITDVWKEALQDAQMAVNYEKIESSEIIGKFRSFFIKTN
jgi:CRISPR-associated endonuclease Cas3-HD